MNKRKNEHLTFYWVKDHSVFRVKTSNILLSLTSKYISCNVYILPSISITFNTIEHSQMHCHREKLSIGKTREWDLLRTNTHFQASYPFAYFSEGASINIIKNRSSYLHPIPCYFPSWEFHLALVTIWSLS